MRELSRVAALLSMVLVFSSGGPAFVPTRLLEYPAWFPDSRSIRLPLSK